MGKTRVEALYDFYLISKRDIGLPELLFVSSVGNAQLVCREWGRSLAETHGFRAEIITDEREKILTEFYDRVETILSDPNQSFLRSAPLIREAIMACAEKLNEPKPESVESAFAKAIQTGKPDHLFSDQAELEALREFRDYIRIKLYNGLRPIQFAELVGYAENVCDAKINLARANGGQYGLSTSNLSVLSVKPGDKVLVRFPDGTPFEQASRIRDTISEKVPGVDFIAVTGDLEFSVVRVEPSDSSDAANNKSGRGVADENGTRRHPYYRWLPQPDITTFELALCMPVLTGYSIHNVGERYFIEALLPKGASRHFKVAS